MKKSIALFVTISFLFIVVGILGTILYFSQKLTENKNFYIAQNSVLIKGALETLGKITKEINSSDQLKAIFSTFPISDENGNFRAVYTITPLFDRVDLNSYLKNGKINKTVDFYIDNILEYYEIQDPVFFKDLLLDTLDTDTEEREAYSEIILQNPDFQNGKIHSYEELYKIEKYYAKITEDKSIFEIPWKKLVFFGDGRKHIIECSLLNKKTAQFMGLVFEGKPTCKNILTPQNKQMAEKFDIIEFNNTNDFWINVEIDYFYNELHHTIDIIYNIHNKKVVSVESDPVY